MLLKMYPENPEDKNVRIIAHILRKGGIVIVPTDSVYGIACDINKPKAIERIARLKGLKVEKADFSFIFNDISGLSEYTKPMSNDVFKALKKNLPGPFTFILEANNKISRIFKNKKRTLGVRIPDNNITRAIVKELGNPILTSSVVDIDEIIEYTTDPSLINDNYKDTVDIIIDGGYGNNKASTVVDCTSEEITVIREGELELV